MKTFRNHLNKKLKDPEFVEAFEEEKKLLVISLKLVEHRNKLGLSKRELAEKANVTQQQLSKIENGINCNLLTFIKVCEALNLSFDLKRSLH